MPGPTPEEIEEFRRQHVRRTTYEDGHVTDLGNGIRVIGSRPGWERLVGQASRAHSADVASGEEFYADRWTDPGDVEHEDAAYGTSTRSVDQFGRRYA
jgi:hypothetical protein